MATAATTLLGLALPVQGELSGTWGDTVNNSITNLLDAAVAGTTTLSTDADVTLTTTTLAANQAREAIILWTAGGTATRYITAPAQSKAYVVINKTSSTQSIVIRGVGPTTGVTIPAGSSRVVAWNGSDFVATGADAASIAGILAAINGGTGQSSYAVGDLLYAPTTTTVGKLADVAVGSALISGGVNVAPSYGKIGLTTHVSGTLALANGGTNATSAPAAMASLTGFTTTATAAGTTTLTNASSFYQLFTGTLTQTIVLPVTSTLALGWTFHICNNSTGNLSVQSSGANALITILPGTTAMCTCILITGTTAASWEAGLTDFSTYTGTGNLVLSNSPTLVAPALGTPASGTVTNLTGTASININGTVGATTANSGAFTTLSSTSDATINGLTVGRGAGANTYNTVLGVGNLGVNSTGVGVTTLGYGTLAGNTTGNNNTGVGVQALLFNQTGSQNTAVGANALYNTTSDDNVAVGFQALYTNSTGTYNTSVGSGASYTNLSGTDNTASGWHALYTNSTGLYNCAFGSGAASGTTSSGNCAFGYATLNSNTTGQYNVALGHRALYYNTNGSGNTAIAPMTNAGTYAPVFDPTSASNRFCMGSTAVTNAYIQVAWTVVSDARDKTDFAPVPHGLDFVTKLQPTAYRYKETRDAAGGHGPLRYGFKAQEVLALEGATPVIVDAEDANKLRFNDQALLAVLVNAIKELKAEFDAYKAAHP